MFGGVDSEMSDSGWQSEGVCSFGQQSRLQKRVQEGHPVASPVEVSALSRVAGLIDAAERLSILVPSEQELLVRVFGVQFNSVGNLGGADVLYI